jgi:hypothetical protein
MTYGSIAPSTRKSYDSTWRKWKVFMQTCHHNPTEDQINCANITQPKLLELLLMFVAYCVNVLKKAPTSIPGILSGLKNNMVLRFVELEAFDNSLLVAMKAAVKRLPYSPQVQLPCTYSMVLHIIQQNTQQHSSKDCFTRLPDDPFLSYRSESGTLHCLVYTKVHDAIAQCATVFDFNPQWFKPHSLRMAAPTVLRASGGDDGDILNLGRWAQVPTSLRYQGTSIKNNNRVLRAVSSPTLFTATDIHLTRLLPTDKGQHQQPTVRRF